MTTTANAPASHSSKRRPPRTGGPSALVRMLISYRKSNLIRGLTSDDRAILQFNDADLKDPAKRTAAENLVFRLEVLRWNTMRERVVMILSHPHLEGTLNDTQRFWLLHEPFTAPPADRMAKEATWAYLSVRPMAEKQERKGRIETWRQSAETQQWAGTFPLLLNPLLSDADDATMAAYALVQRRIRCFGLASRLNELRGSITDQVIDRYHPLARIVVMVDGGPSLILGRGLNAEGVRLLYDALMALMRKYPSQT